MRPLTSSLWWSNWRSCTHRRTPLGGTTLKSTRRCSRGVHRMVKRSRCRTPPAVLPSPYTFGGDFEDLRGSETARPFAEELGARVVAWSHSAWPDVGGRSAGVPSGRGDRPIGRRRCSCSPDVDATARAPSLARDSATLHRPLSSSRLPTIATNRASGARTLRIRFRPAHYSVRL